MDGWEDESSIGKAYVQGIQGICEFLGVTNLTFKKKQQTKMSSIFEGQHPQNLHSKFWPWLGSRYELQMVSNAPGYRPTEAPPRPPSCRFQQPAYLEVTFVHHNLGIVGKTILPSRELTYPTFGTWKILFKHTTFVRLLSHFGPWNKSLNLYFFLLNMESPKV